MRPAHFALILLALGAVALWATFIEADGRANRLAATREGARALVARLQLTDPVLFTEARYTRHLSQADLHSAFQDHPLAFEHFPSGSLVPPPAGLLARYAHLD
ncbi:MAG: hypothetical protein N2441_07525 [Rhodocyclaceae bacterium]|nr:hypothetical protein [Rhodocyclaceae bacterium]